MTYRVKICVPCGDCHYFYAPTLAEANVIARELAEDLNEIDAHIYVYADTRHGHVRIT